MSGIISSTSQASTALFDEGSTPKVANPLVTSSRVPEPRRNARRRFSESAFSTSSMREHIALARSHSLPSLDAASSSPRTLTREGVVSAPGRGEGERCCATGNQGVGETGGSLLTVPPSCEQRGGPGGGAVKHLGRAVPGEKGLVVPAAADDRPPKAFHNFVFRRNRRDASKHNSSSTTSSREGNSGACGGESLTCASQGDAADASGGRRRRGSLVGGNSGGNGCPGGCVESLYERSRREWETAQERRVRPWVCGQTSQTRASPGTPSDAFSILSFGGGRKLGCCGGGAGRVLKCQRCGSARIRLFARLADDATAGKKRHSVGDSVDNIHSTSRSSLAPTTTSWAAGNTADLGRNREWAGTLRIATSAGGGVARGSRSSGGSRSDGISRESRQSIGSGSGGGENWKKGWRFRGDECRPGPVTPAGGLLVPSRRS